MVVSSPSRWSPRGRAGRPVQTKSSAGALAPERPPAGRPEGTGVPDRAQAREERTGLAGAGVALGWEDRRQAGGKPAPADVQRRSPPPGAGLSPEERARAVHDGLALMSGKAGLDVRSVQRGVAAAVVRHARGPGDPRSEERR